ncbi:MAG: universal stress protein [Anaerolineales bacterium]|jgi:nucleotide-binding universal stress UspA family protein
MQSFSANSAPFKRLMLAVDGSEHSQAAARMLAELPCAATCQVRTVAVLIPRQAHTYAALETAVQTVDELLSAQGLRVETELISGDPAEQIVQAADEYQPDLIVMGARGLRATLGILLGGVAQQVVEYARWPVLVVRAPYTGLRQVLLVTDGSPSAINAVAFTSHFPLPEGVVLSAAHVLPPMITQEIIAQAWALDLQAGRAVTSVDLEQNLEQQAELEQEEGQALLDQSIDKLAEVGVKALPVLLRGDAATEILDYAREHQVDLIIAGSRGLGQVRGWLLGSVSRKLLHYAQCSVLVVRTPNELS